MLDSESAQQIDEGDANIEPTDKELDVKEDIHSQSDSNGISPADLVDVPKGLLHSLVGKIGILKDPLQLMGKGNGLTNKLVSLIKDNSSLNKDYLKERSTRSSKK